MMAELKNKRDKFTQTPNKSGTRTIAYVAGAVLVLLLAMYVLSAGTGQELASTLEKHPDSASDTLTIPLSELADGKAHFYEYESQEGKTIRFFALKSSDAVYRAAFDACDVCYREGKGYSQEDDYMVCNNCGKNFLSTKINEVKGGCNPAPLRREVLGDSLVILKSDLDAGGRYF